MVIVILTNKYDITTDLVVDVLKKRQADFIRINTEDLPTKQSTITFPKFSYHIENRLKINNFEEHVHSVLFRRPGKPFEFTPKNEDLSESTRKYVTDQWNAFVSGLISIPNVLWINDPRKNSLAEVKINQLYLAEKIGFKIPKTCITNNKESLDMFWNECNKKIIAKSLSSPLIKENNQEYFMFSNRLSKISDISDDEILVAPTIFQEEIQNKIDYRVTIIGDKCFIVRIDSDNSQVLDWRTVESNIKYSETEIPTDIKEMCIDMVSSLGLIFGAIDIVQNNDGYYFLEINPNGEWGWLQKNAKLPIAEALADKMIEEHK